MSVPVLSGPPAPKGAQKSLTELREQAAAFTNATIDATGIPDGWYAGDKSYDLATGAPLASYAMPDAGYCNDVAQDDDVPPAHPLQECARPRGNNSSR